VGLDESGLVGQDDCLTSVAKVEVPEDAADVCLTVSLVMALIRVRDA
jgi:hypothetical protein